MVDGYAKMGDGRWEKGEQLKLKIAAGVGITYDGVTTDTLALKEVSQLSPHSSGVGFEDAGRPLLA